MAKTTGIYLPDEFSPSEEGILCCHCGERFPHRTSFYKTKSPLYIEGILPICKECLNRLFVLYTKKFNNPRKAVQRICMAFDIYYSEDVFEGTSIQSDKFFSEYMHTLMTNVSARKKATFDDNLDDGFKFAGGKSFTAEVVDKATGNISKQDTEKWGGGFSKTDYAIMNEHYDLLKKNNPNCDSNQEIFIIDLCYIKMQQLLAARDGRVDDFNKLTDSYRKTFTQASLKAGQADNVDEGDCYGKFLEMISEYSPEEFYTDKKLFADYDEFGEYMSRMVHRPWSNLVNGTTYRDPEFSIGEGEYESD